MTRLDPNTIGASAPHEHFHRTRGFASLVAATAAGIAVLAATLAILAGVGPAESIGVWILVGICVVVALTGFLWRSDAPDAREAHDERERRGF